MRFGPEGPETTHAPPGESCRPTEEATTRIPGVESSRRSRTATFALLVPAIAAAVSLAACSGASPSTLKPHGPGAARIAGLWWFMFAVSAFVVALIGALLLFSILPRRRRKGDDPDTTPAWATRMVVVGGVVFPVIVLSILWVLTLRDMDALSQPATPARLEIHVTGYQWWWKVAYPRQGFVTANDIHVPTGQPVRVVLTTFDVNHSFWVPQLTGKTDLIAGKPNTTWIEADNPGVYRGQCAEFCGLQHAHMALVVVAEEPEKFAEWKKRESLGAPTPQTPEQVRGQQVFLGAPCANCHNITGIDASATLGPDLTHVRSRPTLAAGMLLNTRGNLAGWISNAPAIKPGAQMPPNQLAAGELQDLLAYLDTLR